MLRWCRLVGEPLQMDEEELENIEIGSRAPLSASGFDLPSSRRYVTFGARLCRLSAVWRRWVMAPNAQPQANSDRSPV